MSDKPCFVGIDVAKAQLDIALRPSGERWAVPNDARGVATLVDRVQTLHPTLIVLEATGGLERLVTSALAVLRLMTSSYFMGRSMGKSAGLTPCRILST